MFEPREFGHGIMHVIAPELGITLPGLTLCCSDSHSCTNGALGALAWGIGGGELTHILATQTSVQKKAEDDADQSRRSLPAGTHGKDIILRLIGEVGVAAGNGHAVEYAGSAIRALPMEGRFTICNMSVEFGARFGMIAPDETTLTYVAARPYAPQGALWDAARCRLARARIRSRRTVRPGHRDRSHRSRAAGDLGQHAGSGAARRRTTFPIRARKRNATRRDGDGGGARLHGPQARRPDRGHADRLGLHRLLHQQPAFRPARRCRDRERPQGVSGRARLGCAGLDRSQAAGRSRRSGHDVPRRRLRVARARLLDVSRRQWRHCADAASAAYRPRTATSSAARVRAAAPISQVRCSRQPRPARAPLPTRANSCEAP